MRIRIRNTKDKKSYAVEVNDGSRSRYLRNPKLSDEQICDKCGKPLSECACEKIEDEKEKVEEKAEEKVELTKEQFEQFEELLKLLPDLKKLVEKDPEEKPSKKEPKEKEEEKESKKEEKSEKEEKPAEEEKLSKKDAGSNEEEDPAANIILEESDDDNLEIPAEFEFEEEDVIEDEGGSDVCDSVLNPGVIEKSKVSDSIEDTISHEQEVAKTWDERYNKMLRS